MGGPFHVFAKIVHVATGGIVRTKDVEKVAAPILTATAVVASAGTLAPALATAGMGTIAAGATAGAVSASFVPAILNNTDVSLKNAIVGGVTGGACAGINIPNAPIASKVVASSVGHITNSVVTGADPTKDFVKTFVNTVVLQNNNIAGSVATAVIDKNVCSGLSHYANVKTKQFIEAINKQSDQLVNIKNNVDKMDKTQIKDTLDVSKDLVKITDDKIKYESTIKNQSEYSKCNLNVLKTQNDKHIELVNNIKSKINISENGNVNVTNKYCVMDDNVCFTQKTTGEVGVATKKMKLEVGSSNIYKNGTKTSLSHIKKNSDIPSDNITVGKTISSSSNINGCYGVVQKVELANNNSATSTTEFHVNNNCVGAAVAAGIATGVAVSLAPEIAAIVGTGTAINAAIN